MFSRALRMAFWVCFDHLGKLILLNLCCILLMAPFGVLFYGALFTEGAPPFVPGALFSLLAISGVMLPVMAVGLAWMVKEIIETREGHMRSFLAGIRQFGVRAVGIGLIVVWALGIFLLSAALYVRMFADTTPLLGFTLGALSLWGAAFTCLTALYTPVALVQKNVGIFATLKLSAMLVFGNLGYTLAIAFACGMILVAAAAPPVLLLFSLAPIMVLLCSAYEILSRYYDAAGAENAAELLQRPTVVYNDDEDDFLNRGIRDFFYPWKQ